MFGRRKPSRVSRIAIAEAEYATGERVEKPQCWALACRTRRCPGYEIIDMGDERYCPMRLGDSCPHEIHRREVDQKIEEKNRRREVAQTLEELRLLGTPGH